MEKELLIRLGAIESKLKALKLSLTPDQLAVHQQYLTEARERFREHHLISDKESLQLMGDLYQ